MSEDKEKPQWKISSESKDLEFLKGKEKLSINETGITIYKENKKTKTEIFVPIDNIILMREILQVFRGYNSSQGWNSESLTKSLHILIDEIMSKEKTTITEQ